MATVVTRVFEVVTSPERFPLVIEVEPENSVRFPLAGEPVTVTEPVEVPHAPTIVVSWPPVVAWTQLPAVSPESVTEVAVREVVVTPPFAVSKPVKVEVLLIKSVPLTDSFPVMVALPEMVAPPGVMRGLERKS